ncbi:hypothetical protein FKW77_000409 [Venturia effusa]|uniref:Uncharacterized protein n=1 Tax=Venturia effusa TaxID=50376 RepID=A0A517LHW7_9PEZI|nr:hypothetical protein FKW77_000409 [Venturia effusa]
MGKTAPPPAYRDDSTLANAASLNPAQGGDDSHDAIENPPAYTDGYDSMSNLTDSETIQPYKVFPEMHAFMNPRFDSDPAYAEQIIRKWATIPPAQMIRLVGTHKETTKDGKKEETSYVIDFDIKLRLTEYLPINATGNSPWVVMRTVENSEETHRGTILKKMAKSRKGDAEGAEDTVKTETTEWCHLYCASHSRVKTFSLVRQVTGLDTKYLHEALRSMINNINYRGHLDITFPVENKESRIYSSTWQNRWRLTPWIYMIFYLTLLFVFTWPYLFFATKRWAVIKVDWAFSRTDANGGNKRYATISERAWYAVWAGCIEKAVLQKRQGLLTEEDLARANSTEQEFMSGHQGVDTAVLFFGAGLNANSQVNRSLGWGGDC